LQLIWDSCEPLTEDSEILSIRRRALQGARMSRIQIGAIAAAVALTLLAVGTIGVQLLKSSPDSATDTLIVAQAGDFMLADRQSRHYSTAIGERSNITLPDHSVVDLNTDTEIRTLFTNDERRIVLVRGQALFNVAHDADRPFSVLASGQVITALGTEFEVRLDQGEVAVTLLQGRVTVNELSSVAGEPLQSRVLDNESATKIELAPGERLKARNDGPPVISNPDVEKVIDWTDGFLSFNTESLETAVYEMNRYSERKIIILDDSLKTIQTGGTFKAGVPDGFIIAITSNYPVDSQTDPKTGDIMLRWIESP